MKKTYVNPMLDLDCIGMQDIITTSFTHEPDQIGEPLNVDFESMFN